MTDLVPHACDGSSHLLHVVQCTRPRGGSGWGCNIAVLRGGSGWGCNIAVLRGGSGWGCNIALLRF